MKAIYLFLFLLPISLMAQNHYSQSDRALIYQISAAEAEEWHQSKKKELPASYFRQAIDTIDYPWNKQLPLGHYLYVKANEENLLVNLKSVQSIELHTLNNDRDLAFQLYDSTGQIISDAKAFLNDKSLDFDEKTNSFRAAKQRKIGFLKVKWQGETAFFDLEKENKKSFWQRRWQRFKRTKTGWIIDTPVRLLVKRPYRYFYRGFSRQDWHIYWKWPRFLRKKTKQIGGYIAFSQPKYRPNDTIRVRVFVAKKNGKPWKDSLQMTIYGRKKYLSKTIYPDAAGDFTFEMPLRELKLDLDQGYYIEFKVQGEPKYGQLKHYFRYEDYELDRIDYTFRVSQDEYASDERVILFAEGKDQNSNTIRDGEMTLILLRGQVQNFDTIQTLIPDTLWQEKMDLKTNGETQILLPDSIFVKAKMQVHIHATLSNSAGEFKKFTKTISVERRREQLRLGFEDGQLVGEYLKNGKSTPTKARLFLNGFQYIGSREEIEVALPMKMPVNSAASSYSLHANSINKSLSLNTERNPIQLSGTTHRGDSVFFQIQNPYGVPVQYIVRTKNKVIISGVSKELNIRLAEKARKKQAYFLTLSFTWGAREMKLKETAQYYEKMLQIELEQPRKVQPGERAEVRVKVTTIDGKPAPNVHLTAGAINSEFKGLDNLTIPQISYKRIVEPFSYNHFNISGLYNDTHEQILEAKWYLPLALDTFNFYQIRYGNEGVWMDYRTVADTGFYANTAQFSPHLVQNGKALPIYLIYCNNRLVYSWENDDKPPFAFVGKEGYNRIEIRSRDFSIRADSVLLKNGQKLELAIDVDNYKKVDFGKNIRKIAQQNYLSQQELRLLHSTSFVLKNPFYNRSYAIWQDHLNIHSFTTDYRREYRIGPLYPQRNINVAVKDVWATNFAFESGFRYHVSENRERLYEDKRYVYDAKNKFYLPEKLPFNHIGSIIYSPRFIQYKTPPKPLSLSLADKFQLVEEEHGDYLFKVKNTTIENRPFALMLEDKEGRKQFVRSNLRHIQNYPIGTYQLTFLCHNGSYYKREIRIAKDSLHYEDWGRIRFIPDTAKVLLNELIKGQNAYSFFEKVPNPKVIGGRAISGYVQDESGEPLIGANVLIKGTTVGTVTNIDGKYELEVPEGEYELEISYTGFEILKINTEGQSIMDVVLMESALTLDAVVVTALGISRSETAMGYSVATISQDNTALLMLQGKTEGLEVIGRRDATQEKSLDLPLHTVEKIAAEPLPNRIRTDFRDYAFWQPNLRSDKNGEAVFQVKYPDNLTAWTTYAIGMDKRKRAGMTSENVQSFLPVSGALSMPRFLVAGDTTTLVGKAVNYTENRYDLNAIFKQDNTILHSTKINLEEVFVDEYKYTAPMSTASLKFSYLIENEAIKDGEVREMPVFPVGTKEAKGTFHLLEKDTSFTMQFAPEYGDVHVLVEQSALPYLERHLKYLINYQYGCNEQTASRLIGLLLKLELDEIKGENTVKRTGVQKMITRLEKSQNEAGGWGWWSGGEPNHWMTIYVLRALHEAKKAGFESEAYHRGLKYLTNNLETFSWRNQLSTLHFFSDIQQPLDYATYLAPLDTLELTMQEAFVRVKIQQTQGLEYTLDSLLKYEQKTVRGGLFWSQNRYGFYNTSTQLTLLAYQIYKKANQAEKCRAIRAYFIRKGAKDERYYTTFEKAQILLTVLPEFLINEEKDDAKYLIINGVKIKSDTIFSVNEEPLTVAIQKEGRLPMFLTAYQIHHNPKPTRRDSIFDIRTEIIQKGAVKTSLEKGEKAKIKVYLEVKEVAEYVLIEVPIPAGCSYGEKRTNWYGGEVQREYFREKTAIYCRTLPVGKYEYEIEIEPRFTGRYTLNPTRAEEMYAPIFFGRNEVKKVGILD